MSFFNSRTVRAATMVGAALVFAGSGALAQVSAPQGVAPFRSFSSAQLEQMLASAIPMENILAESPLERREAPVSGTGSSLGARPASPSTGVTSFGGEMPSRERSAPMITTASRGPEMRVGSRFSNWSDDASPTGGISAQSEGMRALNYGAGNASTMYHFNDSLVVPFPVYYEPYRSTGLYVFQAADGLYYRCTATLINQAILVTAGHCVHDGSGSDTGWNQSGVFYPGYTARFSTSGQRFGYCQVTGLTTTTEWYNTGALGQGSDVAMAVCGRLTSASWAYVNNRLPGEALGYFGFCYSNCILDYNFLTQLGYPANYHDGNQMTVSQHLAETVVQGGPDYVYGTGMGGGSSGGPQVQNIGRLWDLSVDRGQNTARNVIYAVTSWGYDDDSLKIGGAAPISGFANQNNAIGMYNQVCLESRQLFGNASCSLLPT